jgi:diaminopimelate epimerase
MHYFNNDGTPAELCVNGVRCTAKFAVDNNLVDTKNLIVKAPVGDIKAFVENDYVKIEAPLPTTGDSIEIDSYTCTTSEVGNPHLMVEVDDVEKFDLEKFSVNARKLDVFSNGVNVEIYSVVERKFIYARVNERGVGETDACGSGALALFTYLREINKVEDDAIVLFPGGELELSYEKEKLYLKGEVTYL